MRETPFSMIPKACKRLAEVDFPIAVVSRHSAREKSIRHGHPSTLHLWWARRPLAACRAMLLALLLPDPCDEHCPEDFKIEARNLLPAAQGTSGPTDKDLRQALLKFIGDFANWDLSSNQAYLETARGLVKAAHGEEPPLVVDPFAGGGSIPLEALRIGCDAFASDLNPVACLILKTMLEDIPRHGPKLAEELRKVGAEIKAAAEKELAEFYPPDPDGAKPIAYLWARTVICDSCGAEIPLVRSFWLCKKAKRKRALRCVAKKGHVEFEVFTPKKDSEVPNGTVTRAKASCLCCHVVLSPDRVRAQLREKRGGADVEFDTRGRRTGGARLLAVVTLRDDQPGRQYRVATERDYQAVWKAAKALEKVAGIKLPGGLSPVPDEPTPAGGGSGAGRAFSVRLYGMTRWGDLFTARQKLALVTVQRSIAGCSAKSAEAKEIASLAFSRFTDITNALCQWKNTSTQVVHLFTRQALPIIWDFAEADPFGEQAGDYSVTLGTIARVVAAFPVGATAGHVKVADACHSPLPDESVDALFTDPPYYDAIPYADLSDFFFVWLKRTLPGHSLLRDPFDPTNSLTPKTQEAVQDEVKVANGVPKDRAFFEATMARAFADGRRILREIGIGCVVFAHKTTEGWEALLSGMIQGGWVITASWPVTTEMAARLRAQESAALAASVHLVCRPRPADAPVGDWSEVVRELPKRIGHWMEHLASEGVRGADLVFACIGPAMEIYSRYSKVEDAEGREIPLGGNPEAGEAHKRGFLAYVWETVGRLALEQVLGTAEARARNSAAGALEEDARLTALFLWTVQSTEEDIHEGHEEHEEEEEEEEEKPKRKAGLTLIYDVARRFAQPLGIHLDRWEGRVIETEKGIVRLIPVRERAKPLLGSPPPAGSAARYIERDPQAAFAFMTDAGATPEIRPRRSLGRPAEPGEAQVTTTLDRVHAAMLLLADGQTHALRALLKTEQSRGPDFLRLANALSALYPKDSEEKRLLDAMLLTVPK